MKEARDAQELVEIRGRTVLEEERAKLRKIEAEVAVHDAVIQEHRGVVDGDAVIARIARRLAEDQAERARLVEARQQLLADGKHENAGNVQEEIVAYDKLIAEARETLSQFQRKQEPREQSRLS